MATSNVYSIRYLDHRGDARQISIEAPSETHARLKCGIPAKRIESCSESYFGRFMMQLKNPKLPLEVQSSVLSGFSGQLASGAPVTQALDRVASKTPRLKNRLPLIENVSLVSERLSILGFDPQVVLLAQVGENSGEIDKVLSSAADDLIERKRMLSEFTKALVMPCLVTTVGFVAMVIAPLAAKKPLDEIRHVPGLTFNSNLLTDLMYAIYWATTTLWWAVLGLIAVGFIYRSHLWQLCKGVFPFTRIDEVVKLRRALVFLSSLQPLLRANVDISTALKQIQASSSGGMAAAMDSIGGRMRGGGQLSKAFDTQFWPDLLVEGMSGFDNVLRDMQVKILERLLALHNQRLKNATGRLVGVVALAGTCMGMLALLMIFGGMTFPMMNIMTKTKF